LVCHCLEQAVLTVAKHCFCEAVAHYGSLREETAGVVRRSVGRPKVEG
jgi:hypothetical protein